jgi:recombination protein RecR
MAHSDIEDLIRVFSKLPGLGPRSARRVVLHLMRQKEKLMLPLADGLARAAESIKPCVRCGNLDSIDPCHICNDGRRDPSVLCVVEEVADLWAIERCNLFKGQYHVLGGTLSAMDDRGPSQLNIEPLIARAFAGEVKEIILATNATLEGQTTSHYLMDRLNGAAVSISRLAQGIPIGGELDYLDDGTLGAAMRARLPA